MTKLSKSWVVSADMGYGHQRAVHPLSDIAEGGILSVGKDDSPSKKEQRLWARLLAVYEIFSRARGIPFVGRPLFGILDSFLHIPSYYPIRNLSDSTLQVNMLASSIKQGMCDGMLETIRAKSLPLITSFYAPAIAADMNGMERIYCIICDADLNRVWVAKEPWESRITYFAPCGKAAQRLRAYGVADERIFITGFPLSTVLLGDRDLGVLKSDLAQRLHYLDPNNRFWPRHGIMVEHFLGKENCRFKNDRVLTISYSVGGAGAQKEFGRKIAQSFRDLLNRGALRLNLIAGTKPMVKEYFDQVKNDIAPGSEFLRVIYADTTSDYFRQFDQAMRTTDILWTKPSELSFFCGLGIPIIMSPAIGSQEKFNRQWLHEMQAGFRQENPDYAHQWLMDLLRKGRLADAAWAGFLKARKMGTFKIREILDTGTMSQETSPIMR